MHRVVDISLLDRSSFASTRSDHVEVGKNAAVDDFALSETIALGRVKPDPATAGGKTGKVGSLGSARRTEFLGSVRLICGLLHNGKSCMNHC